jgi:5-methyltetrahydrofolate--homocysteine methyltransferase
MQSSYLDAIKERVVIFDGAMGVSLQARSLTADDFGGAALEGCNEMLNITRPDVVREIHASFLDVGVDAIETNTFGGFDTVLAEYDLEDRVHEINVASARLAREVASSYADTRWVAGSIGPGTKLPSLGHIDFVRARDGYEMEARALLEGGVDLFLVETQMDLLNVKAAMIGCRRAMQAEGRQIPIQIQVTIELTGRMLPGTEIGAAYNAIRAMKPDAIGINCATGPSEMSEHLRYLSQHSDLPIACMPNAGLPSVVDGKMHYDLTPPQLAEFQKRFVTELGVSIVGGCCGTTPEHLEHVVAACKGLTPAKREPQDEAAVSSLYSPVALQQELSYLAIGERTNANGSKKFREAMLEGDWETCTAMAREQIKEGAHVLDVCVDYVGRDGTGDMAEIAKRFATEASVPLVLDSTEPQVIEAGLQYVGGRAILNSANLEEGEAEGKRFDRIMKLAQQYGAAVIILLIDEEGQARDVEWKMRVAHRIHDIAVERYGLRPEDLIFDALTFPLSTGDDDLRKDAMNTIEAIRRIKAELPGVSTVLGLSNVSFGLSPAIRHVLNSVFLYECQQVGLDAAIVHAAKIMPMHKIDEKAREVCLDLIYDRRRDGYDPLEELLNMFEGVTVQADVKEDRSDWPVGERLKHRIIDGEREGLEADLDEALGAGIRPLDIINDHLLDGMKVVGELFGSGEMQLPFVLRSAETMKKSVAHLEPHMEKLEAGESKGRIVLATVKGDVHDIGKNLVDIILTNNGYDVYNLGIKIAINEMIEKAQEVGADLIGMSGLLVKSTLIMRENLEELNERNLQDIPVILGGAALNRTYVERDLREVYNGRVFYGKDAFEGLEVFDKLMGMKRTGNWDPDWGIKLGGRNIPRRAPKQVVDPSTLPSRSPEVETDNEVFKPPFLGARIERGIAIDEIAKYINETALFRNQWQYRPNKGESDAEFKDRIRPELREMLADAKRTGVLVPQVAYGYFAANQDGNDVVIWSDDTRTTELTRFPFPRQTREPYLCIADFFKPVGEPDYAAFHIVTMGATVSEETAKLFAENKYGDYLKLHGIGVEMAEALAEYWHHRIRTEWGFVDQDGPSLAGLFRQQYRGGRYSWGYPACPDLEDNMKVAELLDASRIGIEVNEETGFQYQPEQTTSALICHHPKAKYFVAN